MFGLGTGNERNIASEYSRKRQRLNAPSVKFRGVLPQQNGNWGAQIYANHQRIWLGTFRTEKDAAMAFDSASVKLRRGDPFRNFPVTPYTFLEPSFQDNFPDEEILDMIKDGTYQLKFRDFVKNRMENNNHRKTEDDGRLTLTSGQVPCRQLFQKELTPSDVGKLNRLVIPKKYAVKHFPSIRDVGNAPGVRGNFVDDTELVFRDRHMKAWKFRYCYWKSSQSFVFTKGWNRFVREKELRAKDVVTFYACKDEAGGAFLLIDVSYFESEGYHGNNNYNNNNGNNDNDDDEELELKLGEGCSFRGYENEEEEEEEECTKEEEISGIRLFGVQIN